MLRPQGPAAAPQPHGSSGRRAVLLGGAGALAPPLLLPPPPALAGRRRGNGEDDGDPAKAAKLPPIPRVKLAPGLEVSQVIKGCWQLDGKHHGDPVTDRTAGGAAIDDMERFVRAGVTTFDTSDAFGPSEALIGQFRSLSPRVADASQVLTKLTFMGAPGGGATSRDMIEYRVRAACTRLGLPRLPLVQLHWDDFGAPGYVDVAAALADLQRRGLVGAWGVCNWDVPRLLELIDAGLTPATNQVCYSVIDRRAGLFLPPVCAAHGVRLLAYGTLAGAFIGERYLGMPANKAKLDTVSKVKYGTWVRELGGWTALQDMLTTLQAVGRRYGVSPSVVAMRWVLQQDGVAAIVVGARNAQHLGDARRMFSFALSEDDALDIDAAWESARQPTGDVYAWERGGPFG